MTYYNINTSSNISNYQTDEKDTPLSVLPFLRDLKNIKKMSHQVFEKRADDAIDGVRYVISSEPSTLRPVKSWVICIEKWRCEGVTNIVAQDVLFLRLANVLTPNPSHHDLVREIIVGDVKIEINSQNSFNAIMAATLLISKIDAGRFPDIEKTLKMYGLLDRR